MFGVLTWPFRGPDIPKWFSLLSFCQTRDIIPVLAGCGTAGTVHLVVSLRCVCLSAYDCGNSHPGYHLFRQTKNFVEICDFRIGAEIIDLSRGFRSFRTPEMESSRQVTKIVNFGKVFKPGKLYMLV